MQRKLREVRATIRKAALETVETISYRLPAYIQDRLMIYFAAFADHISVYAAPREAPEFKKELARIRVAGAPCRSRSTGRCCWP